MPKNSPSAVTIKTYQVGFGDCILVSFKYPEQDRHVLFDFGSMRLPKSVGGAGAYLEKLARQIGTDCGGKLTALVVTHRHRDHMSGLAMTNGTGPGKIIRDLKPDVIVQPWTEDPAAKADSTGPADAKALRMARASLQHMSSAAEFAVQVGARAARATNDESASELQAIGLNNIKNPEAVKNLMTMPAKRAYVYFGSASGLETVLPDVNVHVLGPPTLKQSKAILSEISSNPKEYWQLRKAFWSQQQQIADVAGSRRGAYPWRTADGRTMPLGTRWHRQKLLQVQSASHLNFVRSLDAEMNNTSVILLLEVNGRGLLFPGDAQYENWSYALSKPGTLELLKSVEVYKVGHHGSRNATPKSMWNAFQNRGKAAGAREIHSFMSTLDGVYGKAKSKTEVPRTTLKAALGDNTILTNTQDYKPGVLGEAITIPLA